MFPHHIAVLTWLFLLTVLPFLFAIINIRHFIQFWVLRRYQYINTRKPKLLMIYTVLVSISLFIITPTTCLSIYVQSKHQMPKEIIINKQWFSCFLIFDSVHGSILCTLITIIAVRVWLLFYDHKFAIATVDRVWRKTINPSDNNFFLNHKRTLGNDLFLLKLVFTIWILVICVIVFIVVLFRRSSYDEYINIMIFFALRVFIAIPVAIFIFTICYKIKTINDEFHLKQEMQYLVFGVCCNIMVSITALVLVYSGAYALYIFEAVVYSFDILFIVCSSYIQIKYILKLLMKNLNKIKHQNGCSKYKISMVDVLRTQHSFDAFMRHCVNELSVESLLFLVEVAQYKATLTKYNAPDPLSKFYSLNVQKVNLRQILLESRYEQRMSFAAEPYAMSEQNSNQRRSIIEFVDSRSTGRSSCRSSSIRSGSTLVKKENKFQQFQQSILGRKWLPISFIVPVRKKSQESLSIPQTQIASKSMRNLKVLGADTEDSTEREYLKLEFAVSLNKKASEDNMSADDNKSIISKINIGDTMNSPSATPPDDSPSLSPLKSPVGRFNFKDIPILKANNSKTPKTPKTPHCTVSAEWIKDFATFLYKKYIEDNAEHAVNISGWTRKFLIHLFHKEDDVVFFEYIVEHSGGEFDRSECPPAAINQQSLINTYLYHVFDQCFDEIWHLLRQNAFMRFTLTDAYRRLIKEKENSARLSGIIKKNGTNV